MGAYESGASGHHASGGSQIIPDAPWVPVVQQWRRTRRKRMDTGLIEALVHPRLCSLEEIRSKK